MNWVFLIVMAVLATATGAQAKNHIYGVTGASIAIEGEGYKLFVSDKILNTVDRIDNGKSNDTGRGNCNTVEQDTSKNLGDTNAIRSDNRLSIPANTKISYAAACSTYHAVVGRLKTADDIRKLWLLFGDSVTDAFVVETLKNRGMSEEINEEVGLLIESKRLSIVSQYLEYFLTKNKEWKLTDYTFLSQAFKSQKGKTLSPAYSQFIEALLTGDADKAFQVVKSIDIENLGTRFVAPGARDLVKEDKKDAATRSGK
jgi:hypothetical protein